jgi:hypothetical protein
VRIVSICRLLDLYSVNAQVKHTFVGLLAGIPMSVCDRDRAAELDVAGKDIRRVIVERLVRSVEGEHVEEMDWDSCSGLRWLNSL